MKDKSVKISTETCMAFFHNVIDDGLPGAGKILLARVLPNLTRETRIEASLDVMRVYASTHFPTNEISMKEGAI
jgi:hypothetical protein